MKYKILIGCMLCLFSFIPKGAANLVLNPYTSQEISADSIIERVMTFAPSYESIVSDYRANLYIKGKMNIQKKNFILRYVPSMFRLQKGVREYLLETYSDLHYTAPNIYDQKVKASQGTVRGNRGLPGLLEYFSVNIYSSSLLNDERLLSPLAKNGQKYYKYRIDSVMGDPNNLDYRIRFIPRTKSDQLVGGYMIVSSNVWSVREIRFSGRSELITFTCWIKMGEVGKKDEFLPIRYDVEALFKFLGNKVDGNYTASLDYKSIELKERKVRKKEKKKYNLSESFSLQCDTNAYKTDASTFGVLRPIPLSEGEKQLYKDYTYRRDTVSVQQKTKSQAFWGTMGDLMVEDYKFNLSNIGSVRFSPFINPLLFSYSGSNGLSYRQDFRYNRIFRGDKWLRIVPKLGYNFTRKEFYWSLNADFEYWPQKRGFFRLSVGNGNRIYSSKMLDELKAMPDSIFNFDLIHLEYFNFRNDSIANALFDLLAEKVKEGVEVRAMFDAFGNWSNNKPLKKRHLKKIREQGIEIVKFDPFTFPYINHAAHRDHRKIAVIDGEVAYTGGMNIADYYINGLPKIGTWRDMHMRIEGDAVNDLQEIFLTIWNKETKQNIGGEAYFPKHKEQSDSTNVVVAIVDRTPKKNSRMLSHAYAMSIYSAQKNVHIVNPYFVPTSSINKALQRTIERGVDVTIMVSSASDIPFTPDAALYKLHKLMKRGATVYMYNGGFHHSKIMMVDDIFCTVGTANLNSRSLRYDYETNAFIFNKEITGELNEMFRNDIEHCTQLTPEFWKKRSPWKKFVGWFANLFTPFL